VIVDMQDNMLAVMERDIAKRVEGNVGLLVVSAKLMSVAVAVAEPFPLP
jgi:hypothetical protein